MLENKILKNKKIFILAGETSGDFIASEIMKGILKYKNKNTNIIFHGVSGPKMNELGIKEILSYKQINKLGFTDIILNFISLNKKIKFLENYILKLKPQIIITVDAKVLSLNLAKKLNISLKKKKTSIPIIHFVLPTIWAHSPKRVKKWKGVFTKLFSIIPNEENIFKKFDINVHYIGNPYFEQTLLLKNKLRSSLNKKFCIILPGSREKEIYYNLKIMLDIVKKLQNYFPEIKWILPINENFKNFVKNMIISQKLIDAIRLTNIKDNIRNFQKSSVAIACSGTVTLELASLGIPTIAVYKTDFVSAWIGKRIVNFSNVILPNFILGNQVIPFFFQEKFYSENIIKIFKEFYLNNHYHKLNFKRNAKKLKSIMGYDREIEKENFRKKAAIEILKLF